MEAMTQEEVLEFNKRCAEFLGYINTTPNDKDFDIYHNEKGMIIGNKIYTMIEPMSAKFHSDWNWIMEVVEKILKDYRTDFYLDFDMPVSDTFTVSIGSDGKYRSDGESKINSKEAVVQAINQFLIWYNENNR
jgi:hypothetical protein